jgi:hypothetical protein
MWISNFKYRMRQVNFRFYMGIFIEKRKLAFRILYMKIQGITLSFTACVSVSSYDLFVVLQRQQSTITAFAMYQKPTEVLSKD